jgi:hypothetical protein
MQSVPARRTLPGQGNEQRARSRPGASGRGSVGSRAQGGLTEGALAQGRARRLVGGRELATGRCREDEEVGAGAGVRDRAGGAAREPRGERRRAARGAAGRGGRGPERALRHSRVLALAAGGDEVLAAAVVAVAVLGEGAHALRRGRRAGGAAGRAAAGRAGLGRGALRGGACRRGRREGRGRGAGGRAGSRVGTGGRGLRGGASPGGRPLPAHPPYTAASSSAEQRTCGAAVSGWGVLSGGVSGQAGPRGRGRGGRGARGVADANKCVRTHHGDLHGGFRGFNEALGGNETRLECAAASARARHGVSRAGHPFGRRVRPPRHPADAGPVRPAGQEGVLARFKCAAAGGLGPGARRGRGAPRRSRRARPRPAAARAPGQPGRAAPGIALARLPACRLVWDWPGGPAGRRCVLAAARDAGSWRWRAAQWGTDRARPACATPPAGWRRGGERPQRDAATGRSPRHSSAAGAHPLAPLVADCSRGRGRCEPVLCGGARVAPQRLPRTERAAPRCPSHAAARGGPEWRRRSPIAGRGRRWRAAPTRPPAGRADPPARPRIRGHGGRRGRLPGRARRGRRGRGRNPGGPPRRHESRPARCAPARAMCYRPARESHQPRRNTKPAPAGEREATARSGRGARRAASRWRRPRLRLPKPPATPGLRRTARRAPGAEIVRSAAEWRPPVRPARPMNIKVGCPGGRWSGGGMCWQPGAGVAGAPRIAGRGAPARPRPRPGRPGARAAQQRPGPARRRRGTARRPRRPARRGGRFAGSAPSRARRRTPAPRRPRAPRRRHAGRRRRRSDRRGLRARARGRGRVRRVRPGCGAWPGRRSRSRGRAARVLRRHRRARRVG